MTSSSSSAFSCAGKASTSCLAVAVILILSSTSTVSSATAAAATAFASSHDSSRTFLTTIISPIRRRQREHNGGIISGKDSTTIRRRRRRKTKSGCCFCHCQKSSSLSSLHYSSSSSKLVSSMISLKMINGNTNNNEDDDDRGGNYKDGNNYNYYIQFSRVFQRHVVVVARRRKRLAVVKATINTTTVGIKSTSTKTSITTNNPKDNVKSNNYNSSTSDDDYDYHEIVQSFLFLDEAIAAYPHAHILAPKDIRFPPPSCTVNDDFLIYHDDNPGYDNNGEKKTRKQQKNDRLTIDSNVEENECETTIAGMGLYTLCDFECFNDVDKGTIAYSTIASLSNYTTETTSTTAKIHNDTMTATTSTTASFSRMEDAHAALRTLIRLVSTSQGGGSSGSSSTSVPRHFFNLDVRRLALMGHTPQSIQENYVRVVTLLGSGDGYATSRQQRRQQRDSNEGGIDESGVGGDLNNEHTINFVRLLDMTPSQIADTLQNFPMLLMYNYEELECLLRFMTSPLPKAGSIPSVTMVADRVRDTGNISVDWPSLFAKGYGAGLTIDQATRAIQMMPELLALYYEHSRKPSITHIMYHHQRMKNSMMVPSKLIDEAARQLNLEGSDPADAYTFAYLHSLGVSWSQLRILTSALPLWTTVNLDPSWEIVQKGSVRSMFKRPALDYLRQRLQIAPCDIYRLVKTHTRLSTYDSQQKILPTLNRLQGKLELTSAELRKLVLRMPSLMGMGLSAFEDRLDFYLSEAVMSIGDVKLAILKQPSLLQYNVNATLRPKMQFFVKELGISDTLVSRIVKLAPASMGLSLNENLRPKVVSIMLLCGLGPRDVGFLISSSPQILLLSQKGKIEPTLRFLSTALMLREPRELGDVVLAAPRVFHQGLETSIAKKIEIMAMNTKEKSKIVAASIIRNNPTLLSTSNAVLESRIERYLSRDKDLLSSLLPSTKGRKISIQRTGTTTLEGFPIASSPTFHSFDSVTAIYASPARAAKELGIAERTILEACKTGEPVFNGTYLCLLDDSALTISRRPAMGNSERPSNTTIPISIFCSGGVHPSDSANVARGQRRTGGIAIQVFTDGSRHDKTQFLREFAAAARACLGIRVPIEKDDDDGSRLLAVFPLVNPSKYRCELFSCSRALTVMEECLKSVWNDRKLGADDNMLYDIKIYTDSNYCWKLVKSKERLIELGSHRTAQAMLSQLGTVSYPVNIDILHPLARSFGRLNDIPTVEVAFLHSMEAITPENGGQSIVKRLKRQAKAAAMWQFNRDREGG